MSEYQQMDMPEFPANGKKIILSVIIGIIVIVALWKSSVTIGAGEAGVLFKTFGEGVEKDRTYTCLLYTSPSPRDS